MSEFDQEDKIYHEGTDELVCPYCGNQFQDCFELPECCDDVECGECGKHFTYETYVTRTFTSKKADCLNGSPHEWREPRVYDKYTVKYCRACGKREETKI